MIRYRPRARSVPCAGLLAGLLLGLAACAEQSGEAMLLQTLENTVRGACDTADNCENRCPDGTPVEGGGRACD
jgi:hypothetical protein